jgi:antitoxin MazE
VVSDLLVRIGKKRTLVIPKKIAKELGISENTLMKLDVEGDKIIMTPLMDAVWLSIHGEKFCRITLKELEEESVAEQKKRIEGAH